MKTVKIACAVIIQNGQILISKRPAHKHLAHFWEFPGGKVKNSAEYEKNCRSPLLQKPGQETIEEALHREIKEELGITLKISEKIETLRYPYPELKNQTLELHFFLCKIQEGVPQALEVAEIKWVHPEQLKDYSFPPADAELLKKLPKILENGFER
jgi:8-oxo-dGTP diphosphatase